jgi:hypothetical protein
MAETVINSFMIRFIQESDADASWRGMVRHVQSDEEVRFTRIEEALRFIGRYVDLAGAVSSAAGGENRVGMSSVDRSPHLIGQGRDQ